METILEKYLSSLSPKEYKAYQIAKEHLKTSFDLKKSNRFIEWQKNHEATLSSTEDPPKTLAL